MIGKAENDIVAAKVGEKKQSECAFAFLFAQRVRRQKEACGAGDGKAEPFHELKLEIAGIEAAAADKIYCLNAAKDEQGESRSGKPAPVGEASSRRNPQFTPDYRQKGHGFVRFRRSRFERAVTASRRG
jgi:hypothetical protein